MNNPISLYGFLDLIDCQIKKPPIFRRQSLWNEFSKYTGLVYFPWICLFTVTSIVFRIFFEMGHSVNQKKAMPFISGYQKSLKILYIEESGREELKYPFFRGDAFNKNKSRTISVMVLPHDLMSDNGWGMNAPSPCSTGDCF